jgi:hypothetical protein
MPDPPRTVPKIRPESHSINSELRLAQRRERLPQVLAADVRRSLRSMPLHVAPEDVRNPVIPLRIILSCVFVAAHLVGMGILGWVNVGGWHGGLPPISLISFLFSIAGLVLFLGVTGEGGSREIQPLSPAQ